MKRRGFFGEAFLNYAAVVVVATVIVAGYGYNYFSNRYNEQAQTGLSEKAEMARSIFADLLTQSSSNQLVDRKCKNLGSLANVRFTVILPDGSVVGDSRHNPETIPNQAKSPEFEEASQGEPSVRRRFDQTQDRMVTHVALPLIDGTNLIGVLRTEAIHSQITSSRWRFLLSAIVGGFSALALSVLLSLWFSKRISAPLEILRRGVERFRNEDFSRMIQITDSGMIGDLATSVNTMAHQLSDRINNEIQQRLEKDAILASMNEGILAVDSTLRLININETAAAILGVSASDSKHRRIEEIVRIESLFRFIRSALESAEPIEEDIIWYESGERYINAHGTALKDLSGANIGALIVLRDITRIRKLEHVRRDFSANVSHELKTPITAIKGFVETLLADGLGDKEETERFLRIISEQTDRLNAIVDDLMSLARIERGVERSEIVLEPGRVNDVVVSAVRTCGRNAAKKGITIDRKCEGDLYARMNSQILEQAIINLIDNAIKYSDQAGSIGITAAEKSGEIVISVRDHGCGIAKEHLPRVFERFYRADKARSRALGGTGLGLAIVKHVVLAHNGRVDVDSHPGKGSTFTVVVPALNLEDAETR